MSFDVSLLLRQERRRQQEERKALRHHHHHGFSTTTIDAADDGPRDVPPDATTSLGATERPPCVRSSSSVHPMTPRTRQLRELAKAYTSFANDKVSLTPPIAESVVMEASRGDTQTTMRHRLQRGAEAAEGDLGVSPNRSTIATPTARRTRSSLKPHQSDGTGDGTVRDGHRPAATIHHRYLQHVLDVLDDTSRSRRQRTKSTPNSPPISSLAEAQSPAATVSPSASPPLATPSPSSSPAALKIESTDEEEDPDDHDTVLIHGRTYESLRSLEQKSIAATATEWKRSLMDAFHRRVPSLNDLASLDETDKYHWFARGNAVREVEARLRPNAFRNCHDSHEGDLMYEGKRLVRRDMLRRGVSHRGATLQKAHIVILFPIRIGRSVRSGTSMGGAHSSLQQRGATGGASSPSLRGGDTHELSLAQLDALMNGGSAGPLAAAAAAMGPGRDVYGMIVGRCVVKKAATAGERSPRHDPSEQRTRSPQCTSRLFSDGRVVNPVTAFRSATSLDPRIHFSQCQRRALRDKAAAVKQQSRAESNDKSPSDDSPETAVVRNAAVRRVLESKQQSDSQPLREYGPVPETPIPEFTRYREVAVLPEAAIVYVEAGLDGTSVATAGRHVRASDLPSNAPRRSATMMRSTVAAPRSHASSSPTRFSRDWSCETSRVVEIARRDPRTLAVDASVGERCRERDGGRCSAIDLMALLGGCGQGWAAIDMLPVGGAPAGQHVKGGDGGADSSAARGDPSITTRHSFTFGGVS